MAKDETVLMLDCKKEVYNQAAIFIASKIKELNNINLIAICSEALSQYKTCPGSINKHHSFLGGLVVHTSEVLEFALNIAKTNNTNLSFEVIVASCVLHDWGKIYDYKGWNNGGNMCSNNEEHYTKIRHLTRSYSEFILLENNLPLNDAKLVLDISHCILAHHGRKDWGSPIEPMTPEAKVVHWADMLSVHCMNTKNYF